MKNKLTLLCCVGALSLSAQTKQVVTTTQMRAPGAYAPMQLRASGDSPVSTLALSGYYIQGFESTTFPPPGCFVQNVVGTGYTWARSTTQAHLSTASAWIRYDAAAGGGQDWLTMPRFLVSATDSVVFWMRLQNVGYPPDSLCLKVSTTDSLAASFGNRTILKLSQGTNYPPNTTTWYRYAVSLSAFAGQQIILGFKHVDIDGDGLYIDDIAIGTKPANDITTVSTTIPAYTGTGTAITPQANFKNIGSATNTFNVTTTITPGAYTSTQTVTALASSATATTTFAAWTPAAPGTYTVKIYSELAGDSDATNDTLTKTVNVLSVFANSGWSTQTAIPAVRWATGPVFAKPCVSGTDTGYVYLISGSDGAGNNVTLNSAYNITTGTWSAKATIPSARGQITPVQIKNKIYVIGGYGASFSPVTTNSIYDILTNTWTTGAPLPAATGDYATGVFNDSLIYIIGGYSGSADLNTVQVYNVNTNTWATATAKIGTAVSGGRASITGNKIVHVGGFNQVVAATQDAAQLGVIDPSNPLNITWSSLPNFPGGTTGRHGAGVTAQANGLIYFAAGDPDGEATSALNSVYAYNTVANQWEAGPAIPTGVNNINSLAGVIKQDTMYLVAMGGYDGVSFQTVNQWLKIGPVAVPSVQADVAICDGTSTMLTASNGTAYSWSPAGTLDNTAIATPNATPTATTTYTVSISQKFGCAVDKTVTVTINPLPTIGANTTASTVCANSPVTLTGTGADTYTWTGSVTDGVAFNPTATDTYTVTGTDANGCTNTSNITINVNPLPPADAGSPGAICAGDSITLAGSGGVSFDWSPAASVDDNTLASPTAGPAATTTYTVSVTDANGCINSDSVVVTVNELPVGLIASSNISCNGLTDGSGSVSVSGTGPYSYLWSTTETTSSIAGLAAGSYSVTITDDVTGCESVAGFTIVEPTALVLTTVNDTTDICDGSVMVEVSGGTFSYTYLWNDPAAQTIDTPVNLCPGTYTVTVTDANGCTATSTAEVLSFVSVSEEVVTDFTSYPNPARENLSISGTLTGSTSIALMDVMGKTVMTIADNANGNYKTTVDISSLPAGVYFLQLKNENSITTKRVVKQ